MRKWMSGLAILSVLPLSGCGAVDAGPSAVGGLARAEVRREPPPLTQLAKAMPAHRVGERRESRIVEDDPDADGIPDYRVIITETFDADGNLLLTLRDEDFEADGIIDARRTSYFGH